MRHRWEAVPAVRCESEVRSERGPVRWAARVQSADLSEWLLRHGLLPTGLRGRHRLPIVRRRWRGVPILRCSQPEVRIDLQRRAVHQYLRMHPLDMSCGLLRQLVDTQQVRGGHGSVALRQSRRGVPVLRRRGSAVSGHEHRGYVHDGAVVWSRKLCRMLRRHDGSFSVSWWSRSERLRRWGTDLHAV